MNAETTSTNIMPTLSEAIDLGPERRHGIEQDIVEDAFSKLDNLKSTREKINNLLNQLAIAAGINAIVLIIVAFISPTLSAKILLIELMVGAGLACLLIVRFQSEITGLLIEAEDIATQANDLAFVELATAREQLEHVRHRLVRGEGTIQNSTALYDLFKNLGPVAMLLLQRETSAVRWGMLGWKVAQSAMAVFKERSQKQQPQ